LERDFLYSGPLPSYPVGIGRLYAELKSKRLESDRSLPSNAEHGHVAMVYTECGRTD
jgi:hypothetical protein